MASPWRPGVGVAVTVGVGVPVGRGVSLGVGVGVSVGEGVAMFVGSGVLVSVALGVAVSVAVEVAVSVAIGVALRVGVSVTVGVGVTVGVSVAVGVAVEVSVGVGVGVTSSTITSSMEGPHEEVVVVEVKSSRVVLAAAVTVPKLLEVQPMPGGGSLVVLVVSKLKLCTEPPKVTATVLMTGVPQPGLPAMAKLKL
jgi:hypothetical protein